MPRISEWIPQFGVRIVRAEDRPDWDEIKTWEGFTWRIADVFTTRDGRWYEQPGTVGAIPGWAAADYDRAEFDDRGAATHLFAASRGAVTERLLPGAGYWLWSSGLDAIRRHDSAGIVQVEAKASGWANSNVEHGSGYTPPAPGPWCMAKFGKSDVLAGVGLPWSWHISTFCVWAAETEPPQPPLNGEAWKLVAAAIDRLNASLREAYRLSG